MILFSNKNARSRKKIVQGFSLIELMVSLSVFSMVMLISTGTLLIMIDINAKAQALYSSTTNISYALDNLTREIRTGYNYNCFHSNDLDVQTLPVKGSTADCPSSDNAIAFTRESDGARVGFRKNDISGSLEKRIDKIGNSGSWIPITSDKAVTVDVFDITVDNSVPYYPATSNTNQPVVDIVVKGSMNNGLDQNTTFNIQSHIVQRRLDL
ncbi:MAG: type II secretion system GspH family protein [Candidatus Pacebacteria bacterium]|nr:type II secretion system GspH family protein [Candidatus Paceibacterota bacterium]MCF7857498.1 type II secretion system GspH family protein [Candidatus Paceibacterota bacterium]